MTGDGESEREPGDAGGSDETQPRGEPYAPDPSGKPPREELDRTVCVCFSVSLRKLVKFCRFEKPVVPTQLSECYGAGTGCGWCRPFLEKVFEEMSAGRWPRFTMSEDEYRALRKQYHREKGIQRE